MQRILNRWLRFTTLTLAFFAGAGIAHADTLTLAWDPNPEPDVQGYVVYIGNAPGGYSQQIDVGRATQYVLNAAPGQQYCFAVSAYAPGPIEGERSPEVCATTSGGSGGGSGGASNLPPTLANPGDQSSALGAAASLTLTASDPEGAQLTFSVTGLPPGLSVERSSGAITGAPTQAGAFPVAASVSDGSLSGSASFTWTVTTSAPGVPTPRSPSGPTSTTTPTFEWDAVPTATTYRLWVDDSNSINTQIELNLTPTQAGCATTGTVCRHNPGVALVAGPASWSVRASNAAGIGPWSGAMDFSIADGRAPAVTITTPTSNATHSVPSSAVAIGGTASDDVGVVQVTWSNDRGGAGSATGTTTWSVPAVPLSQGANVITVTARDAENNVSTDTLTVTRTDGQPPAIQITLPTAEVSHRTTDTTIAIGGTAADEFGVTEVRWSSSRGASGVANGTTNWGVPAIALAGGTNVITVTARDAAGNSATDMITVDVADGAAPTVTIVGPTSAATFSTTSATVTLSGTASDAFGVALVTWANSRGGSGTASGTTGWTVSSVALQQGENVITVTAKDAAGQTATDTLTVTRTDAGAPTVVIATPTSQSTYSTPQAAVPLGGTASDDFGVAEVTWSNDRGGSGTASGTTNWSIESVALQSGTNTITVTARDASGQKGSDVIVVTRTDGEKPTVAITSPTSVDAHSTTTAALSLGGTAADEFGIAQVTWSNSRGGGGTATGTTAWSVAGITLQPGSNVLTVTARDNSGNTATDTLTVTLTDNTPPTINIAAPTEAPSYSTLNATVELGGTASDLFGVTEVRWTSDRGASGAATGTATWSVASVALSPGANVITVTARDAAGQSATDTITITRTDGDTPTVAISMPTANPSHSVTARTVALGGTARDNFGITQVSWANDRGGSGVATGTSSWSVAGVDLQAGANVITITARDAAGNAGRASLTVTLTDGVAPEVRFATPTAAASFTTTIPTLSIAGTASDEFGLARVAWTNDRGGSGVATGTTSWSAAGIALRAGTNLITVTATDTAGNTGTARLSVVAKDATRPTVSISAPGPKVRYLTASSAVAMAGTSGDDFGLASIAWSNDRGGSGSVSGTTAWSVASVALQPGNNVVTVTATDEAGNSGTDVVRIVSDARKPNITIAQPVTGSTYAVNTTTMTLGGVATDDLGVTEVSWSSNRGGSGVAAGTGTWSATGVALVPGVNVLTVTARDEVGNVSSATLTVLLDARVPGVSIETPTANPTTFSSTATIALRGTANDDVGVTEVTWTNDRGGAGSATGATAWAIPGVALQPGANLLTVTARDAAGNASTDTLTVHYDTRAPVVTITAPTAAATFAATASGVALAGAATDDGAITEVRWANNRGGGGVATGTSRWTVDRAALQPGANEITITARDAAGNSTSARLVVTATDRTAPTVRITGPAPSETFSTAARIINLEGTAADDFGVTQIAWASDRGTSGVARGTGTWIAGGVALQPGVNVIAVTALDSAGNSSSDVLKITVDSQLPVVTIKSPSSSTFTSATQSVVVSGTAADDGGITQVLWASDRGPSGAALGTSAWTTPTIRLEPGPNVVSVTARDGSGNSTTATLTIVYGDSAAPVVTIGSPTTGSLFTTTSSAVSLGGMAKDDFGVAQVSWSNDRGGSGVAFGTTGWGIGAVPLAVGTNVITVTARDAAGLTGTATLRIMRTGAESARVAEPTAPVAPAPAPVAPRPAAAKSNTPSPSPAPVAYPLPAPEMFNAGSAQPAPPPAPAPAPVSAPRRGIEVAEPVDLVQERQPARPPLVNISAPSSEDEVVTDEPSITLAGTAREASVVMWTTNYGSSGTAIGRDRWSVPDFALPVGKTVVTVTARNAVGDLATDTLTITRRSSTPLSSTLRRLLLTRPGWHRLYSGASRCSIRQRCQGDLAGRLGRHRHRDRNPNMEHCDHRPADRRQQDHGDRTRRRGQDEPEGRVGRLPAARSIVEVARSVCLAAVLLAAPAAVSAETLIVTWDQNPDRNVTAYRVFIGTSAGSYTETFDVPGAQTSFVYSGAVAGRRYYVAVAAQVDHTTWGPRSAEISGAAAAAQTPDRPAVLHVGAPTAAVAGVAAASAGDTVSAATSLQVIATGLEPVSALAVSAGGVGLFVEGGHFVRVFETPGPGLQAAPALALEGDAQIQHVALDPAFDRTGRAVLAVSRTGRDGTREVAIERHRLLGGALGESAAIVPVLDGVPSARALLALAGDGRVIVAQAGSVRAFAGTAPTSLGEGPAHPVSMLWDDVNQTVWLTGTDAAGSAVVERLGGTDSTTQVTALPAALAGAVPVAHFGPSGRVGVAGASAAAVVDFDPATGVATSLPANLAAFGTPVLISRSNAVDPSWYVVLRATTAGSTSDTLVRVTARSGGARPIN